MTHVLGRKWQPNFPKETDPAKFSALAQELVEAFKEGDKNMAPLPPLCEPDEI